MKLCQRCLANTLLHNVVVSGLVQAVAGRINALGRLLMQYQSLQTTFTEMDLQIWSTKSDMEEDSTGLTSISR